jgi:hypothetical protein
MTENKSLAELPDFSLVSGGFLFQLLRKSRLCGDSLELLRRRTILISAIAWLPLLILSVLAGTALGGALRDPFLYDFDTNIRFLIALPILIAAEITVHSNISPALQRFVTRGIVSAEDLPAFRSAINSALRMRNSFTVEIALLIFVYTAGHWIWKNNIALGDATWYATPHGTHLQLTAAGYWYAFCSIPIFQFIVMRWYFRLFVWSWLLWRISLLKLHLEPAHPDRAGGLNFLGTTCYSFAPILFAQGAVIAGVFADRVVLQKQAFLGFRVTAATLAIFWVFALLGPLVMFTPHLWRAKRTGRSEYGSLATAYLTAFRAKWIVGPPPRDEQLLGSPDIQSLADMGNSYDAIRRMRLVPFGLTQVTTLAALALAPLLPLLLTVYSLDQLVGRLLKIMF